MTNYSMNTSPTHLEVFFHFPFSSQPREVPASRSLFFRYFLQPRENGGKSVKVEELGSLRLNIVYTEDHVFPTEHYTPLRDLLLHSANVEVSESDRFPPRSTFRRVTVTPLPRRSARVGVHRSYSGGGVPREAGGRRSPRASLPPLRQDRSLHQRHRSRRSQPHTVSLSACFLPMPLDTAIRPNHRF